MLHCFNIGQLININNNSYFLNAFQAIECNLFNYLTFQWVSISKITNDLKVLETGFSNSVISSDRNINFTFCKYGAHNNYDYHDWINANSRSIILSKEEATIQLNKIKIYSTSICKLNMVIADNNAI